MNGSVDAIGDGQNAEPLGTLVRTRFARGFSAVKWVAQLRGVSGTTPRLAKVLRILGRHGFGRLFRTRDRWPSPEQVREAFEELGVVFLKLGQALSTRRDLLPPSYIAELEKLQDRVPAEDAKTIRRIIEAEFHASVTTVFAKFDDQPIAAATIAQVHRAELPDGRAVVVKVQRPGLQEAIADDLATLAYLAAILDFWVPAVRPFDPQAMVREFHQSLLWELDFRREAQNVRRFRTVLADTKDVWVPDVIMECTTNRVITFEHSPGAHIRDYVVQHPDRGALLARRLAALFLRQVFQEGLFHADPHPGNFFVLEDGTLCLHDFGIIGRIDERLRERLVDLLESVIRGDARAATNAYFELGLVGHDVERHLVENEVAELLAEVRDRSIADVSVGHALESLLRLGSRYRIRNPGFLLTLSRAFVTLEGVMRKLDPKLSVLDAFRDALPGIIRKRFSPARLAADAGEVGRQVDRLLREAPSDLRRALRRIADGDLGDLQIREHSAMERRHGRWVGLALRTVAAGFLLLAGSVLLNANGWRLMVGGAFVAVGLGGLIVTAVRSRIDHRT